MKTRKIKPGSLTSDSISVGQVISVLSCSIDTFHKQQNNKRNILYRKDEITINSGPPSEKIWKGVITRNNKATSVLIDTEKMELQIL